MRTGRWHFEIGETAVTILCDERYLSTARRSILQSRDVVERFIHGDPLFSVTLEPYLPPVNTHPLIERMCMAAEAAGVGPMAAVAGAIAEQAIKDIMEAGASQAVVDNGGDIALLLRDEITVSLYAGEAPQGLGFKVQPRESVFGICTSSGTVGPSISFGMADAATVVAENVALADACATRLGNLVTAPTDGVMRAAVEDVTSIPGVDGAMVMAEGRVALKGYMPELVRAVTDRSRITRVKFPGSPRGHWEDR